MSGPPTTIDEPSCGKPEARPGWAGARPSAGGCGGPSRGPPHTQMSLPPIGLLTVVTFLPAVGALLILLLVPRRHEEALRWGGLVVSLATFAASVPLWTGFDAGDADMQFEELLRWMPGLGVGYHVGVDGISVLLVLLTTFLMPVALASAWHAIEDRTKEFVIAMLLLEVGMVGVFVSLDLFLFFVFWEAMLIPMYFVIGVWGGANRVYAAVKFVLYTMVGSALMLVAILALYYQHGAATGTYTFDLPTLTRYVLAPGLAQNLMFVALALAFAIKVPLFPFHTWLPDAHVEAPTAGSVILDGELLKMGTYGLLRFCLPLFPDASVDFGPWVYALAVIGIVYGAFVSTVQPDLKKLVAYSSVSHLGFVMLGLFTLTPPPPVSSSPPSICCGCTSAWPSARSGTRRTGDWPTSRPASGRCSSPWSCSSSGSASTRRRSRPRRKRRCWP